MTTAYLLITLKITDRNREAAAGVYAKYKQPFLDTIEGARSKELLIRDENVAVLHGFDSPKSAEAYLRSALFTRDVVTGLSPYLAESPELQIYTVA